jgi:alpha-amylase
VKKFLVKSGVVLASALLTAGLASAEASGKSGGGVRFHGGDEIILQGFHWNVVRTAENNWYNILKNNAQKIKDDGFTAIWMPTPWRDQSSWNAGGGTQFGGEGYFWTDFNKNSRYGNNSQLKQAASTLKNKGVKVIYDIVPNHHNRGHYGDEMDFANGQGKYRTDCGSCDDGDPFISGDSDFNTANPDIYNLFKNELKNLKNNYSAGGFRFDFVRGYDPARIDAWMGASLDNGYCVGELWKGPAEYPNWDWRRNASWQDIIKDFSDRSDCSVFDFALKERMQNSNVRSWQYGLNGNPSTSWREVAVTFVDNHDTGYSPGPLGGQHHWPLPDNKRKKAYAYIMMSPGTPTVYWPHMYDWGLRDYIKNLIKVRKQADIRAWSGVSFKNNYSGLTGVTTGVKKKVVFAIDSNLNNPNQVTSGSFSLVVNEGGVRVWKQN